MHILKQTMNVVHSRNYEKNPTKTQGIPPINRQKRSPMVFNYDTNIHIHTIHAYIIVIYVCIVQSTSFGFALKCFRLVPQANLT